MSPAVSLFAAVGADGRASLDLTLPLAAAWRGVSLYGQAVGLDPQAVGGAQLSNAVATTLL